MIPSEVEWRRLYLYTCRIIAAQFPVPVATVPGLFLRAYLDWLVEQTGCRLSIFQEKCPPILASTISPDLTVWMHPRRFELLVADSQCHFGLLSLSQGGGPALRLCIAESAGARPQDLWTTVGGWSNIQAALRLTDTPQLHRLNIEPVQRGEQPVTAAEAAVNILWCRDMADLSADQLAAIIANYFDLPRYFLENSCVGINIKASMSFDSLAAFNSSATHLYIRVNRTDARDINCPCGFLIDKEVTRLVQHVVKNVALPGCPHVRPTHSAPVWNEMVDIIQRSRDQVRAR